MTARNKIASLARELRAMDLRYLTRRERNIAVHANIRSYARSLGITLEYPKWGPCK